MSSEISITNNEDLSWLRVTEKRGSNSEGNEREIAYIKSELERVSYDAGNYKAEVEQLRQRVDVLESALVNARARLSNATAP